MDPTFIQAIVDSYIQAYNQFDIEGMVTMLDPEIEFENRSQGEVNVATAGIQAFRQLAEQSRTLFSKRKQTLLSLDISDPMTIAQIDFVGILKADLPNGMKQGEAIRMKGRTEFLFANQKIRKITDIS